jgi:hypothetical protein
VSQRDVEHEQGEEFAYVDDPVSRLWVLLIVAVFAAIFLYAILLGHGGALSPTPTPEPTPTPALSQSPTVSPSSTPTPSASPTVSPTSTPTPSASPT